MPEFLHLKQEERKSMEKRWLIAGLSPEEKEKALTLSKSIGVSVTIAELLVRRGVNDFDQSKHFFRPDLHDLHDPFLMRDMDKAVERLAMAIQQGENILIYGDYDVDGTTAVALLYSFLNKIYDKLGFYIPDRYQEGYGISFQGIDYAADNNIKLIIALDCGIKSIDKVAYAQSKGIDFIICDHHRPGESLPAAAAVLDPKRNDCQYPYKELSGCGIGFKLAQAYAVKHGIDPAHLFSLLDLLAVSIAADIVPITGENRILTFFGLKQINENPSPGIAMILKLAGKSGTVDISNLVFIVSPRINAAGRIQNGKDAVELLISSSEAAAENYAHLLNQHNTDRKHLDRETTEHALEMIAENETLQQARTTVLWHENWHKGVVGIVASRLTDTYYRPTILLSKTDDKLTGSARSVKDFDIYEAIEACSDLLLQFGGHKYAAGLTMLEENFDAFRAKFEAVVSEMVHDDLLIPSIEIEAELSFRELTANNKDPLPKFYRILKQFSPFGPGNMNPVFITRGVTDSGYAKVLKEEHLKMQLLQPGFPNAKFDAIAFGMSHYLPIVSSGKPFDIAYTLEENNWNGKVSLQLMIKDIKAA